MTAIERTIRVVLTDPNGKEYQISMCADSAHAPEASCRLTANTMTDKIGRAIHLLLDAEFHGGKL